MRVVGMMVCVSCGMWFAFGNKKKCVWLCAVCGSSGQAIDQDLGDDCSDVTYVVKQQLRPTRRPPCGCTKSTVNLPWC